MIHSAYKMVCQRCAKHLIARQLSTHRTSIVVQFDLTENRLLRPILIVVVSTNGGESFVGLIDTQIFRGHVVQDLLGLGELKSHPLGSCKDRVMRFDCR